MRSGPRYRSPLAGQGLNRTFGIPLSYAQRPFRLGYRPRPRVHFNPHRSLDGPPRAPRTLPRLLRFPVALPLRRGQFLPPPAVRSAVAAPAGTGVADPARANGPAPTRSPPPQQQQHRLHDAPQTSDDIRPNCQAKNATTNSTNSLNSSVGTSADDESADRPRYLAATRRSRSRSFFADEFVFAFPRRVRTEVRPFLV